MTRKELAGRFRKATQVGFYHGGYVGKQLAIDVLAALEETPTTGASLIDLRAKVVAKAVLANKERGLYRKMKSWRNFDIAGGQIIAYQEIFEEIDAALKSPEGEKP